MTCQMTVSLGVYVLGAASAGERARLDAHLPGCRECRAELALLAPLPDLLARVPDGILDAGSGAAGEAAGPPRRAHRHERTGWAGRATGVAAAVTALAGAAGGFWLAPGGTPARPPTITLAAADPVTHVTATAALTATSWGTSIQLRVRGVPLNVPCRLIVRSRAGGAEVSGVWDAWHDGQISVPGSAAWRPADIASLQVTTPHRTLVTIRSRAAGRTSGGSTGAGS